MRKNWKTYGVLLVLAAVVLILFYRENISGVGEDKKALEISQLSKEESDAMFLLCRVWGVAKYHHPTVVKGNVDWDQELLNEIAPVLQAVSEGNLQEEIYSWLMELGEFDMSQAGPLGQVLVEADNAWIEEEELMPELEELLLKLTKSGITERSNSYARMNDEGIISFDKENAYENMDYADARYRLLSLFRFWNVVHYYYPYHDQLEDWDAVFYRMLPKMIEAREEKSYKTAVMEMVAQVHDYQVRVPLQEGMQDVVWGDYILPIRFVWAEDRIFVTEVEEIFADKVKLLPGDEIIKVNGQDISERITDCLRYVSYARQESAQKQLQECLFRSDRQKMKLEIVRDQKTLEITSQGYESAFVPEESDEKAWYDVTETIGYINMGRMQEAQIEQVMHEFADKEGLILDMRGEQKENFAYSMANELIWSPLPFALSTITNTGVPGESDMLTILSSGSNNTEYFKGKVVLLTSGETVEEAEFTTLSLRNAPGAVIIGTTTGGSAGTKTTLLLPGNIEIYFPGCGIFAMDTSPVCTAGITPNLEVKRTAEGVLEGRDEAMEAAVVYLEQSAELEGEKAE